MKNKQKIRLLRKGLKYIHAKIDRHEELLTKYWAELEGVDAGLKRVLAKLLNANKEN
jgi:hypothetical protein